MKTAARIFIGAVVVILFHPTELTGEPSLHTEASAGQDVGTPHATPLSTPTPGGQTSYRPAASWTSSAHGNTSPPLIPIVRSHSEGALVTPPSPHPPTGNEEGADTSDARLAGTVPEENTSLSPRHMQFTNTVLTTSTLPAATVAFGNEIPSKEQSATPGTSTYSTDDPAETQTQMLFVGTSHSDALSTRSTPELAHTSYPRTATPVPEESTVHLTVAQSTLTVAQSTLTVAQSTLTSASTPAGHPASHTLPSEVTTAQTSSLSPSSVSLISLASEVPRHLSPAPPKHEDTPQLDVGDEDVTQEGQHPASPMDPILALLVSVFIVSTAAASILLFLKFRGRTEHPEFQRLHDLPMDDLLEDAPLSRYTYQ